MVTVKVKNCKHQGRTNQNTTFVFFERKYGFVKGEIVTPEWVLDNIDIIQKGIEKNDNTKIELKQQ
jgi:hypothetical protein